MNAIGRDIFDDALREPDPWSRLMMIESGTDSRRVALGAPRGTGPALYDLIGPEIAACRQGEVVQARLATLPRYSDHGGMRKLSRILRHEILNQWPDELLHNA